MEGIQRNEGESVETTPQENIDFTEPTYKELAESLLPGTTEQGVGNTENDKQEEDLSESTDETTSAEKRKGAATKKPRKRTGFVNMATPTLVQKTGERTKIARERGQSLVTAAAGMAARTNAKVYLKCQYTGASKVLNYCYGEDFEMLPGGEGSAPVTPKPTSPSVSEDNLRQIVAEGVAQGLAEKSSPGNPTLESSASEGIFNSPNASSRRTLISQRSRSSSGNACQRCTGVDDFVSGSSGCKIPASWFVCSAAGCRGRAHNDCLGLPGIHYNDIKDVAPWYCLVHLGKGRPPILEEDVQPGVSGGTPSPFGATTTSTTVTVESNPAKATSEKAADRGKGRPGRPRGSTTRGKAGRGK